MRRQTAVAALASVATAFLLVSTLTGCGGGTPGASPSQGASGTGSGSAAPGSTPSTSTSAAPIATATPTTSPTPAAPPALPDTALFAISATVKASNGAIADLYQVVYKPTPVDTADTKLLNKQCDFQGSPKWQTQFPANIVYVTTTITATLRPGSPAFKKADNVLFGYSWGDAAFSGDFSGFEAACSSGFVNLPGTVHGVAPVAASDPAHSTYGWASKGGDYGFAGGGNDPGAPDSGGTAYVSHCVVQLSAEAAAASSKIASWPTQPFKTRLGCDYET